jgi:hypothetical protein
MDWFSRRMLANGLRYAIRPGLLRRLSDTMDADFCIEALHEAIARFGRSQACADAGGSAHRRARRQDRRA